jgi:hypothetical protein
MNIRTSQCQNLLANARFLVLLFFRIVARRDMSVGVGAYGCGMD